jgi:DNA polymerase III alpha subunit
MAMNFYSVKQIAGGYQLSDGRTIKCENKIAYPIAVEDTEKGEIRFTTGLFHLHTGYSLLDGAIKSSELAKMVAVKDDTTIEFDGVKVVFCEYPQVIAITDHGNMFGSYEFNNNMAKCGAISVIGSEIYIQQKNGKRVGNHLVLLCKDEQGYHNLCKLLSEAEENFYNKAHVTWENLRKYSDGLVCLSACLAGEIPQALLKNDFDAAMEIAKTLSTFLVMTFISKSRITTLSTKTRYVLASSKLLKSWELRLFVLLTATT